MSNRQQNNNQNNNQNSKSQNNNQQNNNQNNNQSNNRKSQKTSDSKSDDCHRCSGRTDNLEEFGEFVPTFFSWINPDRQRERVEYLDRIGKSTEAEFDIPSGAVSLKQLSDE